jgi:hypothetical protein
VTNGDVFTVQLTADTLPVETDFGKSDLPVKQIRSIKVLPKAMPYVPAPPAVPLETGSQLTVELRDGSHIVGKGLDDTLTFHSSALGDVKLTWSGIRSIEYTTTNTDLAQLTATNGDAYMVQFLTPQVRVETSFGKSDLPVNMIRTISVSTSDRSSENGSAWENSLGMKFVPIPGMKVMFCIWDVRVRDYREYAKASREVEGSWENPQYKGVPVTPDPNCPVANVSWSDAKSFCEWLTLKERADGKISGNQSYRLPMSAEWSQAVGDTKYPWGDAWPPPPGSGNYADATAYQAFPDFKVIEGYNDGYATTSPVGSFKANSYGLYDMGGNVLQWCEDKFDNTDRYRVMRGAPWANSSQSELLSSFLTHHWPSSRGSQMGFRVVLDDGSSDIGILHVN